MRRSIAFGTLLLCVGWPALAQGETPRNILFIVDGSGSMWGRIEGRSKIEIAREVLSERIRNLAPDVRAGLIAYGHRRDNDCADIERLVPLAPVDRSRLIAGLQGIRPKGMTPIAGAIEQAAETLAAHDGASAIILMTDGKETCDADACAVVASLRQRAPFTLQVVGFDILQEQHALELQCLASAGGGSYFTAATVEGLDEALKEATGQAEPQAAVDAVQDNTVIVLDTSAVMQRPFDGGTRFDAAVAALERVLGLQVADRGRLAFRRFGGPCNADSTELVLPFDLNAAHRIVASLDSLRIGGHTTLVDAVNAAIFDFDPARLGASASKRIVIITGGNDPCFAHPQAASLIRQRLQNRGIDPQFRFIGIDLPPDREQELSRIAKAAGGTVSVVRSRAELERQLELVLEVEPAVRDIELITEGFNDLVEAIDGVIRSVTAGRYEAAAAGIERLGAIARRTIAPFRDLGRRRSNEDFIGLFETARELRAVQTSMIATIERLLAQHRQGDADAFNASASTYNELTRRYSKLADRADEIIARLRRGPAGAVSTGSPER